MKTNIFRIAAFVLVFAGGIGSCGENGKASGTNTDVFVENCIIQYIPPPDNCNTYMIVIEQEDPVYNKYYKPDHLPDQFKVDSLNVKVTFSMSEEKHNCGFGGDVPVINIIKIEKQ
jgi:hypothetical protein